MKMIFALLSVSSLIFADGTEEIALYEPSLAVEGFSSQELQFPEPVVALPRNKYSFVAVGLSALVPGLGHTYLGEMKTAAGLFGTAAATVCAASVPGTAQEFRMSNLITAQNTWSYGLYAAYRDVRVYNGQRGYSYKMPTDSLADLTSAPFRFSVLKKPEVWGGLLGAMTAGIVTAYFGFPKEARVPLKLSSKMEFSPFVALPVGVGEESLFRGLLQSQLSEFLTPIGGIVVSSLAFGAVHIPNAAALPAGEQWRYYSFGLPLITGMGAYFGWLTHKNHSLKESVAIHTWYDFIIFSAGAVATKAAITGRTELAFSTQF